MYMWGLGLLKPASGAAGLQGCWLVEEAPTQAMPWGAGLCCTTGWPAGSHVRGRPHKGPNARHARGAPATGSTVSGVHGHRYAAQPQSHWSL